MKLGFERDDENNRYGNTDINFVESFLLRKFTENCVKFKKYSVNNMQEKIADFLLKNFEKRKKHTINV